LREAPPAVIVGVETIPERRAAAEEALRAAGAEDIQARTKKEAVEDAEHL
jgi:predicted O-methyltransferase YrrM